MNRQSLDIWDDFPPEAVKYFKNFGFHFNAKACKVAVEGMYKRNTATNKMEKIEPWTKDQVDEMLKNHGVVLENNTLHDYVFVANMAKADFFKSSLPTEKEVAMWIKDYVDDPDAVDGQIFNRWFSDRMLSGNPVDWAEIL